MNGYADFIYTPYGWRCKYSFEFKVCLQQRQILKFSTSIRIAGPMLHIPKPGQYSKLPHRYIDWSKS